MNRSLSTLLLALLLGGCVAAPPTATPTPQPSPTPSVAPSSTPTPTMPPPTLPATLPPVAADHLLDTVAPGEILFFRPGPGQMWALGIDHREIWAMAADGSDQRLIYNQFPVGRNPRAVLSPYGRYLAFDSLPGAVLADLQTREVITLADAEQVGEVAEFTGWAWSPDGTILYLHTLKDVEEPDKQLEDYLFRVVMPPIHPPEQLHYKVYPMPGYRYAPEEVTFVHMDALYGDRLLAGHWISEPADARFIYHLFDTATGLATGPYEAWAPFLDVSPDGQRVLVHQRHDGQTVQVYIADLLPDGTIANIRQVTPADASNQVYQTARFAPDGQTIIAMRGWTGPRRFPEGYGPPGEIVLFRPDGQGGYLMTILAPDSQRNDGRFSWLPGQGIIVESWYQGQGAASLFEIWLLPFDGSPGHKLADGFSPLAVGGR